MNVCRSIVIGCSCFFSFAFPAASVPAQTPTSMQSDASIKLAAETNKIKEKIVKIGTGNNVTIVRRDGTSFHGSITKIDTASVIVDEVDLRANVEINYQQIKNVDKGYSPIAPLTGKRLPPKTRRIGGWIALGGLGVLLIILVTTLRNPNF